MTKIDQFRALHTGPRAFVLPNAWDVTSALLLAEAGFAAIGTTSLGITAAAGLPDGAGAGRELTLTLAGKLAPRLEVPLTVDLEGGYSEDPAEVADLVAQLASLGVAGVNLEDGVRRSPERHAAIIRAVVDAVPDVFVNARTDTYWLGHSDPQETVRRLLAYRDAGAHGVFVPGLTEPSVVTSVGLPLNLLWRPGLDPDEPGVARISTGSALYRQGLAAALATADAARAGRRPDHAAIDYAEVQRALRS